jgi:entericidin B
MRSLHATQPATNETGSGRRRHAGRGRSETDENRTDRRWRNGSGWHTQQEMLMKKLVALILLIAMGGLSGCNTMEGAGKDIQSGGHAVSETARDVKKEM